MPSIYDLSGFHEHIQQLKREDAKKRYVKREFEQLKFKNDDSINLYDLNQVAEISKIYQETGDI